MATFEHQQAISDTTPAGYGQNTLQRGLSGEPSALPDSRGSAKWRDGLSEIQHLDRPAKTTHSRALRYDVKGGV